jgi:hypothetical protein
MTPLAYIHRFPLEDSSVKRSMFVIIEIGILVGLVGGLLVSPPNIPWLTRLIIAIVVFAAANVYLLSKEKQSVGSSIMEAKHPKRPLYRVFIVLALYWLACILLRMGRK